MILVSVACASAVVLVYAGYLAVAQLITEYLTAIMMVVLIANGALPVGGPAAG